MSAKENNSTEQLLGETRVYRSRYFKKEYFQPNSLFAKTVFESFFHGYTQTPNRPLFGQRSDKGLGPYEWQTYGQIHERLMNYSSGLEYLRTQFGLSDIKTQWCIGIYSINRPEWTITDLACTFRNLISVTIYTTYSDECFRYVCQHSELKIIVASIDKVTTILKESKNLPLLKVIVCMDDLTDENSSSLGHVLKTWASSIHITLISINEVECLGLKKRVEPVAPQPDDIYTICYTSGTTGTPKGVVLSHFNIASELPVFNHVLFQESEEICYMSYLPLSHVYERTNLNTIIYHSGSIGFYAGAIVNLIKDIAELKPTVLPAVPRILNRLYDGIVAKISEESGIVGFFLRWGYHSKLAQYKQGGGTSNLFWDFLVFSKVKQILGGRVKVIISGSAPLSAEILDFLRVVLCSTIHEGYGLTETGSSGCVTYREEFKSGHVGSPFPNVEAKLVDIPEMNYLSTDKPCPRGEICFRGPSIFQGYFKDQEATNEVKDKDGWFHSGDVGLIDENDNIKIIDRKKNIFKLSQGEYIAPEKIEVIFSQNNKVLQAYVYGNSLRSNLVAIIVPDKDTFLPWAQETLGKPDLELIDACNNKEIKNCLLKELNDLGVKCGLKGYEKIVGLHLETNPFSVENNMLTPTFKIKRPFIKKWYQDVLDALYEA